MPTQDFTQTDSKDRSADQQLTWLLHHGKTGQAHRRAASPPMAFAIISITFKQKNLLTGKGFLTVPFTNHIPEISVPPQHTRRQSSSCTVAALPQAVMHAQDHNEDIC